MNIDSSYPKKFKVKVINVRNGEEFTVVAQDNTLEMAHIQAIQNAEWKEN